MAAVPGGSGEEEAFGLCSAVWCFFLERRERARESERERARESEREREGEGERERARERERERARERGGGSVRMAP